jgi:hypothetical protein
LRRGRPRLPHGARGERPGQAFAQPGAQRDRVLPSRARCRGSTRS